MPWGGLPYIQKMHEATKASILKIEKHDLATLRYLKRSSSSLSVAAKTAA
jgi:hypothetical protein